MIIQPVGSFRDHYQAFQVEDQDRIDVLISSMLTSALVLRGLQANEGQEYIQIPFQQKQIQFIVDPVEDALVVALYDRY